MSTTEHDTRVLAGHKAALNNPNVSDAAKEHSREVIAEMGGSTGTDEHVTKDGRNADELHQTRVEAGYKAALSNPRVSDEAKEHAREVLSGGQETTGAQPSEDPHETRVNAGYKSTLSNPNTSEEAKEHAREVLEQKGAI